MLRRSSPIIRELSCCQSSVRRRRATSESAMTRDRQSRRLRFCASLRFIARCARVKIGSGSASGVGSGTGSGSKFGRGGP